MSAENGADIAARVAKRAGSRCEYCRMHQNLQRATFHVEHIVPRSAGCTNEFDNLAFACPGCSLSKSNRVSAIDPDSALTVPIFHPRRDTWSDHFAWSAYYVKPLTAVGRATVAVFDLNRDRRLVIRQAEALFGLFPPED